MIIFNDSKFNFVCSRLEELVKWFYKMGRGQNSKVSGKDSFFMFMTPPKNESNWDVLVSSLIMKGPKF